jgi:hypothetical protein
LRLSEGKGQTEFGLLPSVSKIFEANFGQALKATFTGGVWGAAGSFLAFASGGGPFLERLFKHSFSQAWLEGIRGGNMKHGLMAGLTSVAGGEAIMQYAGNAGKAIKVALNSVVAGTASELGGGKFANGAMTGAFAMLFNDLMHWENEAQSSEGVPDWNESTDKQKITTTLSTFLDNDIAVIKCKSHSCIPVRHKPYGAQR